MNDAQSASEEHLSTISWPCFLPLPRRYTICLVFRHRSYLVSAHLTLSPCEKQDSLWSTEICFAYVAWLNLEVCSD